MVYEDLIILIPSHSLEDFPTELTEEQAAGLLNAFCITWHPRLLAAAEVIPRWHRADDPPELFENRLIIAPECCHDWIPHGWVAKTNAMGGMVLENLSNREEMLAAALAPLPVCESEDDSQHSIDEELAADFLALGFCYLQTELLARHMRHYSNLDEVHLQREAVAAAQAAVSGDENSARNHLRSCFEVLADARERFYPVDCYLIGLCLLIPRLADEHLTDLLNTLNPANIMVTGQDVQEIAEKDPVIIEAIREAWERGTIDIIAGEWKESSLPLLPLQSVLWQFEKGRQTFQKLFGRRPKVWGRRRFGAVPQIPQILDKLGYHAAMHVALDDGIYPDEEQSKIRWEGCDGSVIDAITRIPLAADSATSYLRFPERMAESMDHDHVATVVFARWPEVESPWFEDLRRMQAYAPVLGRFITLDDYFQQTDSPGQLSTFKSHEYLTPFFIQAVARQESDPISRYADHLHRRQRFQSARWYSALVTVLCGKSLKSLALTELESIVEAADPDADPAQHEAAETALQEVETETSQKLAELITQGGPEETGYLVLNPLGFTRTVTVALPELEHPPAPGGAVKWVQWDEHRREATVEVPGMGFAWVCPAPESQVAKPTTTELPLAEQNLLRNEFFELTLSETTGGIQRLKGHGRKPNRLSQQVTYRYSQPRSLPSAEPDGIPEETPYAAMCLRESEVLCSGPALGEIRASGEIIDQETGNVLAQFVQTLRVWRGRPLVEIDLSLDVQTMPDGNPWLNYYGMRFAWNNSSCSLTRAVLTTAQDIKDERFENLHYFEIADAAERTTILNHGLPFQRTTGMRMVDYHLIAAGETRRDFRFSICLDEHYPMQAALDVEVPPAVVPVRRAPRGGLTNGWFFNLEARHVQLLDILPLCDAPVEDVEAWDRYDQETPPQGEGFALRLVETEGRAGRVKLRCFRNPAHARQRDLQGRTISDLMIEDDTVHIDMTAFEIADLELRF